MKFPGAVCVLATWLFAVDGFVFNPIARGHGARSGTVSRRRLRMDATPAGGKVVVVGNGPVMLLAAKRAAVEGYDTHVIAASAAGRYRELLTSSPFEGQEIPSLTLVEDISGDAVGRAIGRAREPERVCGTGQASRTSVCLCAPRETPAPVLSQAKDGLLRVPSYGYNTTS